MSNRRQFIRNLEYGNTDLLIDKAMRNVQQALDHDVTPLEAMQLLTEEYARLMEVPDDLFEDYCKGIMHNFLKECGPDDPLFGGAAMAGEGD